MPRVCSKLGGGVGGGTEKALVMGIQKDGLVVPAGWRCRGDNSHRLIFRVASEKNCIHRYITASLPLRRFVPCCIIFSSLGS
jgi:hypothetical protein